MSAEKKNASTGGGDDAWCAAWATADPGERAACARRHDDHVAQTTVPPGDPARACAHVRALLEKHPVGGAEQGSDAWLEARKGKITASNVSTIMHENRYQTPEKYFLEFTGQTKREFSDFARAMMDFGTANEERALAAYLRQHYAGDPEPPAVFEFGLVPHAVHGEWLAGSPDGITQDGVLIEIKCPQRRRIIPGEMPAHYAGQVQTLLEVFDLETAHYVEWQRDVGSGVEKLNIVVVPRDRTWWVRAEPELRAFWDRAKRFREM